MCPGCKGLDVQLDAMIKMLGTPNVVKSECVVSVSYELHDLVADRLAFSFQQSTLRWYHATSNRKASLSKFVCLATLCTTSEWPWLAIAALSSLPRYDPTPMPMLLGLNWCTRPQINSPSRTNQSRLLSLVHASPLILV
jgi:hypothetical protein